MFFPDSIRFMQHSARQEMPDETAEPKDDDEKQHVKKQLRMFLFSRFWSNYSDLTRPISPKWW